MCCVNSNDSIHITTRLRFRSNASNHFRPSQGSLMYPDVEIPNATITFQTKQSLHVYRLSQCDKSLQATSQTNQKYPVLISKKGPVLYKCIIPKKNLTSSLFFRPFYWGHLFKVFRSFLGLTFPDEESIIKSLMCLRLRVPAWPRNPANQLIRRLSTVIYHRFFSTIQTVVGNGNGISEACNSTSELELLYGVDIDVIL